MSQESIQAPRPLPGWVIGLGSVVIGLHFLAVVTLVLSAASGPWAVRDQEDRIVESSGLGPKFAEVINDLLAPAYLVPLRLTQTYHYAPDRIPKVTSWDGGNHFQASAVYFEARLKNAQGAVIQTLKFPGDAGNFWLRHRYKLLALGLGSDQGVQVGRSEVIPAPGEKMPTVTIWDNSDPKLLKLRELPEHLVPKDRPVTQPSEWSLLLARAYQRCILRDYGDAASVELVRHSRNQVSPALMYSPTPPPNAFEDLVCSFGDYRREK
jgi:hypothetical protein